MSPEFDLGGVALKAFASLILVLGLAVLLVTVLRRVMYRQGTAPSQQRFISVVDSAGVGPKKGIMLVRVADQFLVVGYSETGLSYLTEIKDTENIVTAMEQPRPSLFKGDSNFSRILERIGK